MCGYLVVHIPLYDRQSSKYYGMKLNLKTDADIVAMLDKQPSLQAYVKQLIRADIAAHAGDATEQKEEL